jgi:succinylglutamate desuccinylase
MVMSVAMLPDFESAARRFVANGWVATPCADAMWRFRPRAASPRLQLLITAGVHGDETAPMEMLARRLPLWAEASADLCIDLFVAIGNLDAVAAGRRFIRYDMNRMFGDELATQKWGAESLRAESLAQALAAVIGSSGGAPCVHLDLHTTIRPSRKPTFAIVPGDDADAPLLRWLGAAGLHAAVLSPGPNTTLSAFTARWGAASCTVELGKAAAFGANDLDLLSEFDAALDALVRQPEQMWPALAHQGRAIETFRVTRELIRSSEQFELLVPASAPNFESIEQGQLVARDGPVEIRSNHADERVLFPNPAVALGLRAGLLVAPA